MSTVRWETPVSSLPASTIRGGHEDHPPPGPGEPVEPPPITGHLLVLAVPHALVLERQPLLRPGEVDPGEELVADPHAVLRDRTR